MNFGLQDANCMAIPIVLDYDNDMRDVDPLLSKESTDEAALVHSFIPLLGPYCG